MARLLKWLVVLLALSEAGYMVFDGIHAFATGDYVTPSTGEHAGELGPWAEVVAALGIEPRSHLMMGIFVAYGAAWLVALVGFALGDRWGYGGMAAFAFGSLWYLVIGTAHSVAILVLLALPPLRGAYRRPEP